VLTVRVGSQLNPKGETFCDFSVIEDRRIRLCDMKGKSFQRHELALEKMDSQ
jgi:hypothetical protein